MIIQFLATDLIDVKKILKKRYNYTVPKETEKDFQLLHKKFFTLADLIYVITKTDSTRIDFLYELRSDSIQLLTFLSLGFKKATALAIRSCIEDVIRHIYYKDHPIELELLNETGNTQISVTNTFQYLNTHPVFKKYKKFIIIHNFLTNEYSNTSRFIHGSSVKHFQLSKTISQLRMSEKEFKKASREVTKLIDCLISCIIIFHRVQFDQQVHYDHKNFILKNTSDMHKKIIHCL